MSTGEDAAAPEPAKRSLDGSTPASARSPAAQPQATADSAAQGIEPQTAYARGGRGSLLYREGDYTVCAPARPAATTVPGEPGDDRVHISAAGAEYYADQQAARFIGDVEIIQTPQRVLADEVIYNNTTEDIEARGSVYYERPDLRVESAGGRMNLQTYQGTLQDIEYNLPKAGGRGEAGSVEVAGARRSRFRDISYTTCAPGREGWLLQADEIELHHALGIGEARNARLRFQGVPILYLPYATFPVGVQRQSGFLAPSVGYGNATGVDVATPYYLNLAPNMDATLTPRILTKRGIMLGGELRYLTEHHEGALRGEILPNDAEREQGGARGAFAMEHTGLLGRRWTADVDVNYVSDSDYLDDLGDSLALTSQRQLERRGDLRYHGDDWSFLGRVQHFQTVDEDIAEADRPYSRLPQAVLTLDRPVSSAIPLTAHLDTEYVYFRKDDAVQGHRLDLYPALSLEARRPWGYVRPKVGVRHTVYRLEDTPAGMDEDPDRTLPIASLDAGLVLERRGRLAGHPLTQTLEPRLYYLYVEDRDQDGLPVFDSSERDFTFDALFRENRFNGADRIGDANQLTLALESRTLSGADGAERLRLGVGRIYYFEDRDVQLPGARPQTDSSSPLVAGARARLGNNWSVGGAVEWDPDEARTERSSAELHYDDDDDRILNLAYRLRRGLAEDTDVSARWPLGSGLHAVARWRYSLQYDQTVDAFMGIEYDSCCWVLRAVGRHWADELIDGGDTNTGIFLQLELKGLTSLGSSVDDMLEKGILGYGNHY
ncbi:MAG: LPS-assembly protein LptD [Chromatiales bacterium]|jgi:LPS-assembly protein